MDKHSFIALPGRGAVTVSGQDSLAFLQGLISNDVGLLDTQPVFYACLLTPQGKFLFDFFVSRSDDAIILECEGHDRAEELSKCLNKFKLRSRVQINHLLHKDVFYTSMPGPMTDPRDPALGQRIYSKPDLPEMPFATWDKIRIERCIPDGSRDMVPGESSLAECGIDAINGVSYSKGCYMGQELTARMHYRGLAKKHLYALRTHDGRNFPVPGTEISINGHFAGTARSSCGDTGLALIKDEYASQVADAGLILLPAPTRQT